MTLLETVGSILELGLATLARNTLVVCPADDVD